MKTDWYLVPHIHGCDCKLCDRCFPKLTLSGPFTIPLLHLRIYQRLLSPLPLVSLKVQWWPLDSVKLWRYSFYGPNPPWPWCISQIPWWNPCLHKYHEHLKTLLQQLQQNCLWAHSAEHIFGVKRLDFLGYLLSGDGITPSCIKQKPQRTCFNCQQSGGTEFSWGWSVHIITSCLTRLTSRIHLITVYYLPCAQESMEATAVDTDSMWSLQWGEVAVSRVTHPSPSLAHGMHSIIYQCFCCGMVLQQKVSRM